MSRLSKGAYSNDTNGGLQVPLLRSGFSQEKSPVAPMQSRSSPAGVNSYMVRQSQEQNLRVLSSLAATTKPTSFVSNSSFRNVPATPGTASVSSHISQLYQSHNLPDVIKTTFKSLHDVIMKQNETIERLERVVQEKADWSEVEASLAARATVADVNRSLNELTQIVDRKGDMSVVQASIDTKVRRDEMDTVCARIAEATESNEQKISKLETNLEVVVNDKLVALTEFKEDGIDMVYVRKSDFDNLKRRVDSVESRLNNRVPDREEMTSTLKNYPSRDEVETALQTRAGVAEVNAALQNKCDVSHVVQALESKVGVASADSKWNDLSKAILDIEEKLAPVLAGRQGGGISSGELPDIRDLISLIDSKASAEDMEVLLANKVDRNEHNENLRLKVNLSDLDSRLRTNAEMIATEVQRALLSSQQEVVKVLNKKAYKSDVARSLQGKADLSDIQNQLERKCSLNDFREGLATKADLGSMKRALENCVTREKIAQLENSIRVLSTNVIMRRGKAAGGGDGGVDDLEELKNDLMKHIKQKCDIKHTTHALESKINKHDFEVLFEKTMEKKFFENTGEEVPDGNRSVSGFGRFREYESQLGNLAKEYRVLTQHVSAEMMVGRWIWKSGRLNKGKMIPWNVQCINTNPSNFVWNENSEQLRTIVPGLYEIKIGIFTDRDPRICVQLNNRTVLSSQRGEQAGGVPGNGSSLHGDRTNHVMRHGKHPAGNVTGWTMVEFIAMPPRATLTVAFQAGGNDAQGFLSLRKL